MENKGQLAIKLTTVPNGYALDVAKDGTSQGYLYFTLKELLEGFMYHVGLKETGAINKNEIQIFLTAVTKWHDAKQLIIEKISDEAEIASLKARVSQLSEQAVQKSEHIADLRYQNKKLKDQNSRLTEIVKTYEKENGKRSHRHFNNPNII